MPVKSVSSAPLANAAARPSPAVVVWALAVCLGLQPLTTDLYLPALPGIKAELGASMGGVQLTLSALLLAFGFGQLLLGPLADRIGRRPVLIGGLVGYAVSAIGCLLAPGIEPLVAWRVLQGLCMSAAVVCARAMVRDLFQPRDGMRVLSQGLSGLGVIALASPLIGGLVVTAFGWRAAFAVLWLFAAAALVFIVLALPETIERRNPAATRPGPLLAAYGRIARDPTFLAFASLTTATYAGLFTFLAASSFAFIEVLGLSRMAYGLALASSSLAYLGGTFACRHWLARHGVRGTIKRGSVFTLAGGLSMAGLALAGVQSAWAIVLPQALFIFGHGIHQPCGQAGAVGPFPQEAGTAAALNGFVLAMGAFGVGAWLGVALDDTVLPMTLAVGFWALVTTVIAWTLVQRHGDPAAAAKS